MKNLGLTEDAGDVVEFCRKAILRDACQITRQGKNWYCKIDGMIITVNAYSYTIITAHRHYEQNPRNRKTSDRHCEGRSPVAIYDVHYGLPHFARNDDKRPAFDDIKSYKEFSKYYWYREELQQICKSHGIDASGMKAELNYNIEQFFKGNIIKPKIPQKKVAAKKTPIPLTLKTGLIECGFTFGPRFREFFAEQTGITNFKFNVDMVATARKVKETHDTNFTLGDLLAIYYGKKSYAKYDKVSLQWNKFVHDFCADPATANIPDKLKTAAALWKQVRESTREKVYTSELLSSLRAKRGNPHKRMDCHVADAPRNDGSCAMHLAMTGAPQ